MVPGPDIGLQTRNPLTVRGFQMKPRHQLVFIEAGVGIFEVMNILEVDPAPGEPRKFVDLGAANGACPVVVKRIFVHASFTCNRRQRISAAKGFVAGVSASAVRR